MVISIKRAKRKFKEVKNLLSVELRVRQEAEKVLKANEKKFRLITENLNDMIFMTDERGFFKYIGPIYWKNMGYTPKDMAGKNFFDFIHADEMREVKDVFQEIFSRNSGGVVESRFLNAKGSYVWVEITGNALFDKNKILTGAIITARDISGRKEAQEKLAKAQLLLEAAIEQSPAGILIAEPPEGRIVIANSAALGIEGKSRVNLQEIPKQLHPREWRLFRPDGTMLDTDELPLYRAVLYGDVSTNIEVMIEKPDGQKRLVLVNAAPIRDAEGNIIAGVVVFPDITANKNAEKEKSELEDRLRQSAKMEAVGSLAGGIAHDFNNILTGIIGYSEIILLSITKNDSFYDEAVEIRQAATKAAGLTEQLLAFSRKQVISPKVCNINNVLSSGERMLKRVIGEDINLAFTYAPKVWPIKADKTQIDQILLNLAVNAKDAMTEGGSLIIESANVTIDGRSRQSLPDMPLGEYVMIAVSDSGVGMSEKVKSRIFEPFFTTKEKGSGTGLGLATVYGAVKQNNGYIYVFSKFQKGTTFKIFFPKTSEEFKEENKVTPISLLARNEVILLVEDEEMVRELATKVLQRHGYRVFVAKNGSEALYLFREHKETIDILVSDVVMPNMSGKELFVELRKVKPFLRVLFMSGYAEDEIVHEGILEKDTHFIQKPFTIDEFVTKVREVLDLETEANPLCS